MNELSFRPEELHSMFYGTEKTKTTHLEDQITTKGLDEVKSDLKEIVFKELSAKAQKALDMNPKLTREVKDAVDEMNAADKNAKKNSKRLPWESAKLLKNIK